MLGFSLRSSLADIGRRLCDSWACARASGRCASSWSSWVSHVRVCAATLLFSARESLKDVLRLSRGKDGQEHELTHPQLAKMCMDVAGGMAFLSAANFIHRDLAARCEQQSCDVRTRLTCHLETVWWTRSLL